MNTIIHYTKACRIVTLILFAIAITQPTYCSGYNCGGFGDGFIALITGWLGALFMQGVYVVWFANPFMITAWFVMNKLPSLATVLYLIASLICLSFLRGGEVLLNEAGHTAKITSFCSGYWLWTSTALVGFLSSLSIWIMKVRYKKKQQVV